MRLLNKSILAAAAAMLATSAAWAQVSVSYVKPEDFSDVPRGVIDRDRTLQQFTDYFKSLEKKLPAGQSLKIEVLDIDLAGRLYPRRAAEDIRVMNGGADWPHMHLKYTLEQDGQVLRSGDEELSDMNYQNRFGAHFDSDPLRYEKQMLDDWFNKSIVPKVAKR
ncbi:DUF3016 domain-containing protein [Duganella sp. FT135W]|uniref:DUF3016 domain-containing protein n=1 Tax=Duganella flavida TaxID=2692175 RepID=A0A6L8K0Y8_9BURK|nr:DUF3016 domain-containing protein [Duganella flavida]MYM21133.1 DUF3016 domain-containing protein [Duganella flavida]